MADITFAPFKSTEKVPMYIDPRDANGAIVPGTYAWTASDSSVARLEVAADTLSAMLFGVAPGAITVSVTDGFITDTAASSVSDATVPTVTALNLSAGAAEAQ